VQESFHKHKRAVGSSKIKIIVIIIVICCLVFGGLTPTFNSILINNDEDLTKNNKENDEEIKKSSMDDDVWAIASLYWKPRYPDPGEEVTFHSTSHAMHGFTGIPSWRFHDGKTAQGSSATKTYEKKGSYKVTISVSAHGFGGGSDWDSATYYVPVGADPFPKIKCIPKDPSPGEKVKLDGSDSSDPDGSIISYNWSYYNVNSPGNVTNLGSEVVVYHTWSKQGTYIVSLFTEDDKGNNNTLELTIVVSILKLFYHDTLSRKITFKIGNYGNVTANNVKWDVEIFRESTLSFRSKSLYKKSSTILHLIPHASLEINLKDFRRRLCKIKLVISADADNAVKISKTFYGRIIGKFIYLKEEKSRVSLINIYKLMIPLAISFSIISYMLFMLRFFTFGWFFM
jgi:plastocyanin